MLAIVSSRDWLLEGQFLNVKFIIKATQTLSQEI